MNDKELADKVVALGVGLANGYAPTVLLDEHSLPMDKSEFVRDWRVAGALMEKCVDFDIFKDSRGLWDVTITKPSDRELFKNAENDSLPRSIIEACVEALS
jgi:hypothetical protein